MSYFLSLVLCKISPQRRFLLKYWSQRVRCFDLREIRGGTAAAVFACAKSPRCTHRRAQGKPFAAVWERNKFVAHKLNFHTHSQHVDTLLEIIPPRQVWRCACKYSWILFAQVSTLLSLPHTTSIKLRKAALSRHFFSTQRVWRWDADVSRGVGVVVLDERDLVSAPSMCVWWIPTWRGFSHCKLKTPRTRDYNAVWFFSILLSSLWSQSNRKKKQIWLFNSHRS